MAMIWKRALKRLCELKESQDYKEEFQKIKSKILSKRIKVDKFTSLYIISAIPKRERLETWFEYIKRVQKDHPLSYSINKIREILENGNINEHVILIPKGFEKFKNRYDLDYFFDPTKDSPRNFNPFHHRTSVTTCFPVFTRRGFVKDKIWEIWEPSDLYYRPRTLYDPNKVDSNDSKVCLEIDMDASMDEIKREVAEAITTHKKLLGRGRGFSDNQVIKIKELINKGKDGVEILKEIVPEYRGFDYTKYIYGSRSLKYKGAPAKLRKIQRIAKKINTTNI
jgi:hypothetical protein